MPSERGLITERNEKLLHFKQFQFSVSILSPLTKLLSLSSQILYFLHFVPFQIKVLLISPTNISFRHTFSV